MFHSLFAISMPGTSELIVIGIIILLIFGGSKIPKLFRDLGSGIREFKDGMAGKEEDEKKESEKKS